jgi:hypothetical protein
VLHRLPHRLRATSDSSSGYSCSMNALMRVSSSALTLSGTAARPSGRTWRTISSAVTFSGPRLARYSAAAGRESVGRCDTRGITKSKVEQQGLCARGGRKWCVVMVRVRVWERLWHTRTNAGHTLTMPSLLLLTPQEPLLTRPWSLMGGVHLV